MLSKLRVMNALLLTTTLVLLDHCCATVETGRQQVPLPLTGVADTPPMGWNSWNHYHCSVNEAILRNISMLFRTTGVAAAGYVYVNIDDCWQAPLRDDNGTLQPDSRIFPSGIPKLAEAIHNDGNKFGIYVDQGYRTCQDRPGTLDNELKDAQTFAAWGIDYVKNDACYPQTPNIKGGGIHQQTEGVGYLLYKRFFESLRVSGREMFLSIENPELVPPELARNVSNSRRVGGDIGDQFGSTLGEFHTAPNSTTIRAGPGFFNDLDMLEIGNGHQNKTEYITQFSLWCIAKSPLLLGCDLSVPTCMNGTSKDIFEIILNHEAIAVNQDPLAVPASLLGSVGTVEIWGGPLVHGAKVLLFLNTGDHNVEGVAFAISQLGFNPNVTTVVCRDVWLHADCVAGGGGGALPLSHNITVSVAVHGVVMMRLTPTSSKIALDYALTREISATEASVAAEKASIVAYSFREALRRPDTNTQSTNSNADPSPLSASSLTSLSSPPPILSSSFATSGRGALVSSPIPLTSPIGWPMRGYDASHSGRAPFRGPAACPQLRWMQTFGESNTTSTFSESSAAVDQDGRVFIGSGSSLWALNLSTGDVLWQFDSSPKNKHGPNLVSEFFASPAVYQGVVLVGAGSGTCYGFNATNGSIIWRFQTGSVVIGANGGTGKAPITSSVVVGNRGLAFVGGWDGCMYAFDPMTGHIQWKSQIVDADTQTPAQIRATPALSPDGATVHFPAGRVLYAIDAINGSVVWKLATANVVYTSPSISQDGTVVYGPSGGGITHALSPKGDVYWSLGLNDVGSTMVAITGVGAGVDGVGNSNSVGGGRVGDRDRDDDDGSVVVRAAGNLFKMKLKNNMTLWKTPVGNGAPAAITIDSTGTVWMPMNGGISMTTPSANTTMCKVKRSGGSLGAITIPMDGLLLVPGITGGLWAYT